MSTVPPPTLPPVTTSTAPPPPSSGGPKRSTEIKLISHSNLFYWWPVWAMAFLMAFVTLIGGQRMAVVPSEADVMWNKESGTATIQFPAGKSTLALETADGISTVNRQNKQSTPAFKPRISEKSWPGAVFVVGLLITIVVTNVPLRGLWSFFVIILIVVLTLIFALLEVWDKILSTLNDIHMHMNMATYMTIGVVMFIVWALATFLFDRRSYVIFTPGQIKVCEHIGAGVQAYSTMGVSLEKQRDDLFRHYIYGLGSGDLVLKLPSGDRREVKLPNVLFIGWRLNKVEDLLRSVATT
ncbi:MAG: hypothetical protein ACRC8S_01415 [Fimbriiglobus sp.]